MKNENENENENENIINIIVPDSFSSVNVKNRPQKHSLSSNTQINCM
jgi:hypothetical protein